MKKLAYLKTIEVDKTIQYSLEKGNYFYLSPAEESQLREFVGTLPPGSCFRFGETVFNDTCHILKYWCECVLVDIIVPAPRGATHWSPSEKIFFYFSKKAGKLFSILDSGAKEIPSQTPADLISLEDIGYGLG